MPHSDSRSNPGTHAPHWWWKTPAFARRPAERPVRAGRPCSANEASPAHVRLSASSRSRHPGTAELLPRQGPRELRPARQPPHPDLDRPAFGVRPGDRLDPAEGPGADAGRALLVRADRRHLPQPCPGISGPERRRRPAAGDPAGRDGGARLSRRHDRHLDPDDVQAGSARDVRHDLAGRPARQRGPAAGDHHPDQQGFRRRP